MTTADLGGQQHRISGIKESGNCCRAMRSHINLHQNDGNMEVAAGIASMSARCCLPGAVVLLARRACRTYRPAIGSARPQDKRLIVVPAKRFCRAFSFSTTAGAGSAIWKIVTRMLLWRSPIWAEFTPLLRNSSRNP